MIRVTFRKVAGHISNLFKKFVHKHRRNRIISTCCYALLLKMAYAELERFINQISKIIKGSMATEEGELLTQLGIMVTWHFYS